MISHNEGLEKGLSRTGEYPSASPGGGGVRAGFMEKSQERLEGSDLMDVCEAWEHLTRREQDRLQGRTVRSRPSREAAMEGSTV